MSNRRPPRQKPGQSVQVVRTPVVFLAAVKRYLGIAVFTMDLAATPRNAVAPRFFTVVDNALRQPWPRSGWNWLNPPYDDIAPWVERAYRCARRGVHTAMLLPAAVGANWWRQWVHRKARVLLLNGRITFVGHRAGYPKDLVLLLYGPSVRPGYDVWRWPLAGGRA